MKFKSKVDWWFHLVTVAFVLITLSVLFQKKVGIILPALLLGVLFILILPIYFSTYYVLESSYLYIRCGLVVNMKIDYKKVVSVKESNNVISSPALSMNRIEIQYYQDSYRNFILVSPYRKQEFINELNKRIK